MVRNIWTKIFLFENRENKTKIEISKIAELSFRNNFVWISSFNEIHHSMILIIITLMNSNLDSKKNCHNHSHMKLNLEFQVRDKKLFGRKNISQILLKINERKMVLISIASHQWKALSGSKKFFYLLAIRLSHLLVSFFSRDLVISRQLLWSRDRFEKKKIKILSNLIANLIHIDSFKLDRLVCVCVCPAQQNNYRSSIILQVNTILTNKSHLFAREKKSNIFPFHW